MKKVIPILALSVITGIGTLFAQTDPSPRDLNVAGNYSFTGFSPSASSLPANMVVHQMSASPVALSSTSISDIPLPCTQTGPNNTNVWALNGQGLGIRSNPVAASTGYTNGRTAEVLVAVNTTGRTNVKVSFLAGTYVAGSAQAANFRLRCQYRVGLSGAWSEIAGGPVEYQPLNVIDSVNMGPYALPAAVDNQTEVQVRWVFYHVSGSWNSNNHRTPRVRLDDISITSLPIVTQSAFATACPSSLPFTLSGGSPVGGTYSGTGVSGGNTFNPAVSGPGTFPITYTYTDAFGISNSVTENITVDNIACTTQLTSAWCGATNLMLHNTIYCDPVAGVQDYEWSFTNSSIGFSYNKVKGNNYESMILWAIPGLQYGKTYDVKIRAKIQNQWCNWGPVCTITMLPSIPTTQLNSAYCGITNLTLGDVIYADNVGGATNFQYEFTSGSGFYTLYTKNNNAPSVALWAVPGLQYGNTYNVRVKTYIGGEWSNFGTSCTIALQASSPNTQLAPGSCGASNLTLGNVIYCNPVSGATNFQYEFTTGSGFYSLYTKNNNATSCALWVVPGLQYGQTYMVRVRSYISGVWSNFGNICTITMQSSIPTTQLTSTYCGSTSLTTQSTIYCNPVAAATNFQYEFTNGSGFYYLYTKNNNATSCALWVQGLSNGQTYNVRVRAYVNGVWSVFGPSCSITLGGSARMATAQSIDAISFNTKVFPNPVPQGLAPKINIEGANGQWVVIQVMDLSGRILAFYEMPVSGNFFEAELNSFPYLISGIYMVSVSTPGSTKFSKFIIE